MNYYNEIKQEFINNEIYKKAKDYSKNRNDLSTYYNVGRLLFEAQGGKKRARYGDNLIREYSKRLSQELGKGYTYTAPSRMKKFYVMFQNVATMSQHLSWSHYVELLKLNDINEINYYIDVCNNNLSVRELRIKIKNNEYQRLDDSTKKKLMNKEEVKIKDFIKNPIIINNNYSYDEISEKLLKQLILEDLDNFLKELGENFCYKGNEYKIKLGDRYNYIDLLLYNIKYNCYVVIELKVTELKKEHIGQIQTYMNYIDKNIKNATHESTIGIIICKKDNQFIMEYCSDMRIFTRTFLIN